MAVQQPINPYRKPADQALTGLPGARTWPRSLQLVLGFMVLSLATQLGQVLFALVTARHSDTIQLLYGGSSLSLSLLALIFAWLRQRGSFIAVAWLVGFLHVTVTSYLTARGLHYWLTYDTPGRVVMWNAVVTLVWSSFVAGLSVFAWRNRRRE